MRQIGFDKTVNFEHRYYLEVGGSRRIFDVFNTKGSSKQSISNVYVIDKEAK